MPLPLNINLLIPFKDNKGGRLQLYKLEIERFKEQLDNQISEYKEELESIFGGTSEITIAARSDGYTRKYFWRFKSSKKDRKYHRLASAPVLAFIKTVGNDRTLRMKEIEEELILINANFKVIRGMLEAIDQSQVEKSELLQLNI